MFICFVIILYTTNAVYGSSLPPVVCWRAHVLLCFCACLCIVMSNILLFLVVLVFCVVLCFFLVFLFFVFCLLPVSCGPIGTRFSGLSIIDCPFVFSNVYFYIFISYLELKQNGATIFQCVHKPSIYSIICIRIYTSYCQSDAHHKYINIFCHKPLLVQGHLSLVGHSTPL